MSNVDNLHNTDEFEFLPKDMRAQLEDKLARNEGTDAELHYAATSLRILKHAETLATQRDTLAEQQRTQLDELIACKAQLEMREDQLAHLGLVACRYCTSDAWRDAQAELNAIKQRHAPKAAEVSR